MHIQESHKTQEYKQAKCFKMTEDGRKKSGMNGIIDGGSGNVGAAIKQNAPRNDIEQRGASGSMGGRLKFFKDGKFILELARAREGERVSWVSVPRKTFWPPQASSASTPPTIRQESSNSLSVSDDNSSVQSSPWQRDHSWKQNTPRCNVSSEMTFFYHRSSKLRVPVARQKRRRPFDSSDNLVSINRTCAEGQDECDSSVQFNKIVKVENIEVKTEGEGVAIATDKNSSSSNNNNSTSSSSSDKNKLDQFSNKSRKKLVDIVKLLWDKKPQVSAFKSVLLSNIRHEQMVSPRKRILRELERVTIDDVSNKRSRAKTAQSITFPSTTTSPSRAHNGTAETVQTSTKVTSSYSITSLLGHRKEEDNPSKSPSTLSSITHNQTLTSSSSTSNVSQRMLTNSSMSSLSSPSSKNINYSHSPHKVMPTHHTEPDLSPSPEHYRYNTSSHPSIAHSSPTHALSPPPDVYKLYNRGHGSPNHHYSPLHGLVMNQKSPQYYTPSHRSSSVASPPSSSPRSPLDDSRSRDYNRLTESVDKIDNVVGQRIMEMEHVLRPTYISPYMYSPGPSPYVSHPAAYYNAGAYRNPYQNPYQGNLVTHSSSSPQPRSYSAHQSWSNVSQNHQDDVGSDVPLNLSKHAG